MKFCRHCGRTIDQESVDCPYCGRNTIREVGRSQCPFCREPVRQGAIKCKHCGEFLDGRGRSESTRQAVVYVDKAIINPAADADGPQMVVRGALTGGAGKALPPGAGPLAPVPPAAVIPADQAPAGGPAVGPVAGEQAPPARYECPSCWRYVYEDDSFCENCGRDLRLSRHEPDLKPVGKRYVPADYALMVGAGAPLGLLLNGPAALMVAAVGGSLGLWCLYRIQRARGGLRGTGAAAGGLAAAAFWALMILAFT